mmetsp:Transcript_48351/g.151954  ORF Transcript_48351/g.151954 Transcript_48351/m.151954 type:complete len:273 (+) Transcript_48351:111-929(+)
MSNPYTVLGVERNASEKEISKAYKRAALKWHPDKNTERPELAEKKFKEISDAFQLLNDPDKRAFFDRTGQRPDQQPQMRRRPQYGGAQQVYADELTPEDIFNMFFGVHPGAGRAGARRRTTGGGGGGGGQPMQLSLAQLAPVLMLMAFSLLSPILFGERPQAWRLHPSSPWPLERQTLRMGVPYFVDDSFELFHADGASLATAEGEVERQTLAKVRQRCRHERAQRQKMMEAAGHYQGQERTAMQEQAGRAHMRWCDELSRLEGLERSAGRR